MTERGDPVFAGIDNVKMMQFFKEAITDLNETPIDDEMYPAVINVHKLIAEECIDRGLTEWMCAERNFQGGKREV